MRQSDLMHRAPAGRLENWPEDGHFGVHAAPMSNEESLGGERADFLETLGKHRGFLRHAVQGVTEEQARLRPTVSELCLGGLVKHVTQVEETWARFIVHGPAEQGPPDEAAFEAHAAGFRMAEAETLDDLLTAYDEVARRTDELVTSLPSLDASQPLPPAPWFPPGARWSARRVLLHIIAETAQHAGHADIIRETIDGQKTMG
jgi:uncharacterized damage-inducible protein DinB